MPTTRLLNAFLRDHRSHQIDLCHKRGTGTSTISLKLPEHIRTRDDTGNARKRES